MQLCATGRAGLRGVLAAATCLANPYETTLENGLKVIVKEDPRAPSAVNMVWYRVGAMDEIDGTSGVAHVLEHMMFKGTQEVGPGEFNKRVAKVGGRDNAFTGHDYTAYFQQVPADRLGEMMGLEADRMRHLRFADEDFAKELEVVKEERRMRTDDKPRSLVYEQLMATAFTAHPYRRPIIGWMTDLEQMKSADARQWYRQWYAPNNAYVVVVGDVQHEQVFAEAERLYGGYKVDPLPARRTVLEPRQPGIRTANVRAPADLPYVMLAWRAPTLRDVEKDRDVTRFRCWRPCWTAMTAPVWRRTWCGARRSPSRQAPDTTGRRAASRSSSWMARRPRGTPLRRSSRPCAARSRGFSRRA